MSPRYTLRVFGRSGVLAGDDWLPLRRKEVALVAVLALSARQAQTRERLAALLWGERDDAKARHSLRQALLTIRRTAPGLLDERDGSIRLEPGTMDGDWADLTAARRDGDDFTLVAVAERGELLAGLDRSSDSALAEWIDDRRRWWREALRAPLARQADAAERRGDWTRVRLLADCALRLDPSDAQAEQRLANAPSALTPAPEASRLASIVFTPDLIERNALLDRATAMLSQLARGGGVAIVVSGSSGMGRSRLLAELGRAARPFGRPVLLAVPANGPDGWGRRLVSQLMALPGVLGMSPEAYASLEDLAGSERDPRPRHHPVLAAALTLVADERPVCLSVDDADSLSSDDREFVAMLLRDPPPRVAVLVTVADPAGWPRGEASFTVTALSPSGLERAVRSMLPLEEQAARQLAPLLADSTGGEPRLLVEAVRALVDARSLLMDDTGLWQIAAGVDLARAVPATLTAAISTRLAALPDLPRRVLEAIVAAEGMADASSLEGRLRLDAGVLADALDLLIRSRLVLPPTDGICDYRVGSPAVAEATRQALHPARLRALAPSLNRRAWRPWRAAGVVMASAALVGAAIVTRSAARAPGRIAIGDIRVVDGDSTAPALAELLGTNLARLPSLDIVSPSFVRGMAEARPERADGSMAMRRAARSAGASEMVEGTIVQRDSSWRLSIQRVELATGRVRAGAEVEGRDPFDLIERATVALAESLGARAPAGSLRVDGVTTRSLDALGLYGRGLLAEARGERQAAIRAYEDATRRDSTFVMAHFRAAHLLDDIDRPRRLAHFATAMRHARHVTPRERLIVRTAWAHAAEDPSRLALAESLATAFPNEAWGQLAVGRARMWGGDFLGAVPAFRDAMRRSPPPGTPTRGPCLGCEARGDLVGAYIFADSLGAAEREARAWLAEDSTAAGAWWGLFFVMQYAERLEESRRALERAEREPGLGTVLLQPIYWLRAGDAPRAERRLHELATDGPTALRQDALWWLAIAQRTAGHPADAVETVRLRWGGQLPPPEDPWAAQLLMAWRESGRLSEAVTWFRRTPPRTPNASLPSGLAARGFAFSRTILADLRFSAGDTVGLWALADTIARVSMGSAYGRDRRLHHHVRGLMWLARGDTARAAAAFAAGQWSRTHAWIRTSVRLAEAQLALDRAADAVATLQSCQRQPLESGGLYATRTEVHALLARAFEAAGQPDSAAVHWNWVKRANGG